LNLVIIQERSDIGANVAIRLRRDNPKLYPQLACIELASERLHALEDDGEAEFQA
jgi:hypothetical protein